MPAARRDIEIKTRKDESKLQQSEAVQEFTRRQHEFHETDMRKIQRYQLLQLGQLEQKQNQEVGRHFDFFFSVVTVSVAPSFHNFRNTGNRFVLDVACD